MTVAIACTTGRYASLFRCLSRREGTRGKGGLLRRSGKCSGKNRREGDRCKDQTPAPCDHPTPLWWRRASGRLRRLIGPRPRLTMGIVAGENTMTGSVLIGNRAAPVLATPLLGRPRAAIRTPHDARACLQVAACIPFPRSLTHRGSPIVPAFRSEPVDCGGIIAPMAILRGSSLTN